jgi:peptide/nickel transport system permease protein
MGYTPFQKGVWENLRGMVLPAITLGAAAMAIVARLTRSTLLEALQQDYVRTARAKGLREQAVIYSHALKNAMIPITTILGLQIGFLLGGAVITETIFALPGVGRLVVASIFERDFPLVQGVVLFLALMHLLVNLIVDLLYAYLDPRIRMA